jgi:UDP-N-acetyl-D-mannosaminuronic acid dehydrogenase
MSDRLEPRAWSGTDRQRAYPLTGPEQAYQRAFRSGELPVAVYGLGKMGLPLAAVYADVCGNVVGTDIDDDVIAALLAGDCPIEDEPGLADLVTDLVATGALLATADPYATAESARIHVIVVPTLVEAGKPDLSALLDVCEPIGAGLDPGDLVVVESTVPPRTCADRLGPRLSETSGLEDDFGVAFCPERTASGRALQDIRGAYPKIVGGVDPDSGRAAASLYREINETGVHRVADATTAEAVKVFEGVYRDVNIALANELATYAEPLGIDVRDAIEAANTQPYCDLHRPGPGVGGHCIPYYPYFLFETFDHPSPLLRTAREVNDEMPTYTATRLVESLSEHGITIDEATVAILGVTYRPGVPETRASPALALGGLLSELGADVFGVDPLVEDWSDLPLAAASIESVASPAVDGVVLVTAHDAFSEIDWAAFGADLVVVDGRDALDPDEIDGPERTVHTLGGAGDH